MPVSGRRSAFIVALLCIGAAPSLGSAKDTSFAEVARGKYLVTAGDCVACHTSANGKPFAGGRPIETPFGTIYSPNITPDVETGIGAWSDDDFYRALHAGVGPDGAHLYPAFPYPYFTKLTHDDVTAMRAYLDTVPAVRQQRPPRQLIWPLGYRFVMRGWDWMFFDAGTFEADPQKSPEWNRGAYLVEGAGHCGACHTPKNFAGADKEGSALQGGQFQNWFAPEIANADRAGTGSWSVDDIAEYLKTGRNKHSGATGPMAEVVADSTSKLTDADLHAIAVYLKDVPGGKEEAATPPGDSVMRAGEAIFADSCAGCHQADGTGVPGMFPPLVHDANAQSTDPSTVVRIILQGAQTVPTATRPTPFTMPAFDWKLTDGEVAAVASYVRNSWGNTAPAVTPDQVHAIRSELAPPTN